MKNKSYGEMLDGMQIGVILALVGHVIALIIGLIGYFHFGFR